MALTENQGDERIHVPPSAGMPVLHKVIFLVLLAFLMVLPFMVYPVFAMKVMCFALFAAAFNLLLGFGGLLSFGHAAFFGTASYVAAHAAKVWGLTPELAVLAGTGAAALPAVVSALQGASWGVRGRLVAAVADRVNAFLRRGDQFVRTRHEHPPDRVVRIIRIDPSGKE